MLEERIDVLIQSIDVLNVQLQRLWDAKDDIRAEAPKPKAEKQKKKKTKKPTKKETTPTVEEVEGLCLDIIREKGKGMKKKIQNTIKAHGGELIADCPIENLPALKTALEGLAA